MGKLIEINLSALGNDFGTIESYNTLRTNLLYTENLKVITITSTLPDEGKTVSAFNLAKSFTEIGKKVLLIDGDLRKSSLKKYLSVKGVVPGLSEALTKQASDIINSTNIKNLDVIFSGKTPPNPSELLSSKIFGAFIDKLKGVYDYIIIDTPPVNIAIDSVIIGRISDGTVMVVRNDFVKRSEIKRAKVQLERNDVRIIGILLNRVKKTQVDYKNYVYKYY
ncbi:CpsD/CapB family tyrosine-protein kinase [Clostridium nigeriense]|uniref:CpsD/CapB family tyrosine-protein kinase n=1 Tax=Clostridium nigeriense TaxID=1805470 RepID=UPI003D34473E